MSLEKFTRDSDGGNTKNARTTRNSRAPARRKDETLGVHRAMSRRVPELLARDCEAQLRTAGFPLPGTCPPSGLDSGLGIPSTLDRQENLDMAQHDTGGMISISGRWWSFPGARMETDSWEVECRGYGKLYLHDGVGNVVEGRKLSETEVEQLTREMLLADVLEAAAALLRSGEGWEEATTTDVLNEIEHATGLLCESHRRPESED